jgi:hypothetical protein
VEPAPQAASLPPPDPIAPPLPALILPAAPAPPRPPERSRETASWTLTAGAWTGIGLAPQPLFGGGISAARRFGGRWAPSLHLTVEAGGTGNFEVAPGGASYLVSILPPAVAHVGLGVGVVFP